MNSRGFTLLEVIVALVLVGVVVTGLLAALSQGRRNIFLAQAWAEEESRATSLLMGNLEAWQQLRTDPARRQARLVAGEDPLLGAWEWRAEPTRRMEPTLVDLHRVSLRWRKREVETYAVLRNLP